MPGIALGLIGLRWGVSKSGSPKIGGRAETAAEKGFTHFDEGKSATAHPMRG